jgi:A/G-specific adenine glycosylase
LDVGRSTFALSLNDLQDKRSFRRNLLQWYHRHGRDLPWRRTRDSYAILVSEVMLQQTQVASVLPHYHKWLRRFPDFKTLARASENDVLHAWQGLGYYTRARNLHACAKWVANRHDRSFPRLIEQIRQLPGIGKYTAHAIACFAFDQAVPIVEANTARVLARLFNLQTPIDQASGRQALWSHATSLIPKTSACDYNSALIDLGALICLPRPKCAICPVKRFCHARNPEVLPARKARAPLRHLVESHAFVVRENKILLQQADRRWRGMWILPPLKRKPAMKRPIHDSIFPFTNHRIALKIFRQKGRKIARRSQRWFAVEALESIPIPSPHRRAVTALLH